MNENFELLQEKLGYRFKDISLLETAMTHSSYANEKNQKIPYNERFEFLGDSVLGFVTTQYLFANTDLPEGELTKLRAAKVCENALCIYAKELDLGSALRLGRGEDRTGGRERPSILADAFEAMLAAIYLDGGLEEAAKIVLRFVPYHDELDKQTDYKTVLQEIIQRNREGRLEYILTDASGPDHAKSFTVELHLNSNVIGKGTGRSKKLAEQLAAKEALELMGIR